MEEDGRIPFPLFGKWLVKRLEDVQMCHLRKKIKKHCQNIWLRCLDTAMGIKVNSVISDILRSSLHD